MNDSLTEVEVPLLDINKVSIIFFSVTKSKIEINQIQAGGGSAGVGLQRHHHHRLHVLAVGLQSLPDLQSLVQNTLLRRRGGIQYVAVGCG